MEKVINEQILRKDYSIVLNAFQYEKDQNTTTITCQGDEIHNSI